MNQSMEFPKNFVWGAASSAYQTEGFSTSDGGGESVWDTFCRLPHAINNGDSGAVACDAYHRYQEDIALAASLGIKAYRFSISWSRIDPHGDGKWNEMGLQYYHNVVDCCLSHDIIPYITLHHWELPQALEDNGGWLNRDTAIAFSRYAQKVAEEFSDKVNHFITLNEPQCVIFLGYCTGIHAPGRTLGIDELFACWKHMLTAHALAYNELKKFNPNLSVGIASTGRLCYPLTNTKADIEASYKASFQLFDNDWIFSHSMLFDPICLGQFPDCPKDSKLMELASTLTKEDLNLFHTSLDFIAINIYNGWGVSAKEDGEADFVKRPIGYPQTALKWPITEQVMNYGIRHIYQRYHLPIYISENGLSCNDKIYLDGKVHDLDRIDFLDRYLGQLHLAMQEAEVLGYFHWSLTDNFEWHSGYSDRFGLIYIDYPTQKRIVKDSAYWYKDVICTNGKTLTPAFYKRQSSE